MNENNLFEYEEIKVNKRELRDISKLNSISKTKLFDIISTEKIKAKQFVGSCTIGKRTISIIPKIFSKDNNIETNNKGLLFMLSKTKKLNINETDISNLKKYDNLFEIIIYFFSKNLLELLIKDFKKNYVEKEENLNFLKGKLNFIKNIKYNFVNKAKFYCKYDEFEENILMNQIFKSCVKKLIRFTKSNDNFNLLRKCDNILKEVEFIKFQNPKICDKVKFTRLNFEYEKIFKLAKQLLFNNSYNQNEDNFEIFSFMFDMNKLFEEFIFEILKELSKEEEKIKELQAQKPQEKLFDEKKGKNNFSMKPDIYFEYDKKKIILDTKYKKIDEVKPEYTSNKKGISQQDIYQMFAYSQYYKTEKCILLYPRYEESIFKTLKKTFKENPKFTLQISTINLELDKDKRR